MGTQTENYKLTQPSPEDYNIFKDHNENMDIIDSQLKKLEREKEALIKKKSAFNKDFETYAEKIAMNGTADVGVSDSIARGDHVHPTDTTRAAALHKHDDVYDTPVGVQKKIDAHANQAEPHAGHISHSLATAPNDFLVSSQAGRFVKKTVDEVKGILGFGTAAYTNAANFATADQGTRADNALPAAAYTASDVLEKLMAVDGNASGLDADLLDGKEATAFATAEQGVKADNALPATDYTASDVLEKIMTMDGEKSGLDADLLDGMEATAFATAEQGVKADNALPATAYTAGDVLTKLKTVDGENSGLDADLLDGKEATAFATAEQGTKADNALPAAAYTASDVLTKLKVVDGEKSGLDADLLDGKEATAFATAEQGTKADNAATQISLNSHLTDYTQHKSTAGTETVVGHIGIADATETTAGTVNNKAVSPKNLKVELDKKMSNSLATAASQFLVSSTVGQWVVKSIADVKTLLGLKSAAYTDSSAYATAEQGTKADNALPATAYTASDVLTKLKTVDGEKSGLDADLLDGKEATAFATAEQGAKADNALPSTSYTASDVLTKIKTVDGEKSGLDADLLDGKEATAFATAEQGTKADNAASQASVNTHLSDYVRQPGYGVTVGSANAYTITLSPIPTAYVDGLGVVVKINAANTGASTINVNGLGVKAILDSKGNVLASGKLRLNGVYALRYDGTNFVLLGEAIEGSGSKLDADLLDGKEATAFATADQGIKADAAATQAGFDAHLSDNVKHITAADRTAWNAKQAILSDADILNKLKNVDGTGSRLDADLLDGMHSTDFGQSGIANGDLNSIVQSGMYRLSDNANRPLGVDYGQLLVIHGAYDTIAQIAADYLSGNIYWRSGNPPVVGGSGVWGAWRKIWHDGNDGAGSGLDADLLRGYAPGAFMSSSYGAISSWNNSFSLVVGHENLVWYMTNTAAIVITIQSNASAAIPIGTQNTFIQLGGGTVTFAPASGVTLCSKDTKRTIDGLYASATLIKIAADTWSLIGALV